MDAIRGDVICEEMYNIADAIEALSTFFRYTVTNVQYLVSLDDEIQNILNYSVIQKYRFGNRLQLNIIYQSDNECLLAYKVPKLILQPIIENSIFHGLEPKIDMGIINVMIDETEHNLMLNIEDNGVGMSREAVDELNDACEKVVVVGTEESPKQGGIALRNVNRRIKLLFGEEYGIHVYSTEKIGTMVKITLPKVLKGEEYEKEILRIENGSVEELKHIYMHIYSGEITGLVFEKEKEQNVFLKIMAGKCALDEGKIFFMEQNLIREDEQKRIAEGISIISKKSNIFSELSAEENLFLLDKDVRNIVVHKKKYKKRKEAVFRELGYDCDFGKHVYGLTLYERLSLELIRAYVLKRKIIVLTDIIGVLEKRERDKIWNLIDHIKNQGVAFLIVGSLGDIQFEHLQSVSVFKKNRTLISCAVQEGDYEKMFRILYGPNRKEYREVQELDSSLRVKRTENASLQLVFGTDGKNEPIKIDVEEGKVKEIIWLDHKDFDNQVKSLINGQFDNCYIIEEGVHIEGRKMNFWFKERAGLIVEDPWEQMIFPSLSVLDNIFISVLKKYPAQYVKKRHKQSIVKMLDGILEEKYFNKAIEDLEPHILQKLYIADGLFNVRDC